MEFFSLDISDVTQADFDVVERFLPARFERMQRLLHESDKLRCIGAGALMIEHLGIESEGDLIEGERGKPALAPGRIKDESRAFFNVSHSGKLVVLACDRFPIGVDVEEIEERNLKVARRVFVTEELEWMAQSPIERFHLLWTQKESVMKATGLGMKLYPESFCVMPFQSGEPIEICGESWECESWIDGGYAFSICTRCADDAITTI